jgi:hypothetical protein
LYRRSKVLPVQPQLLRKRVLFPGHMYIASSTVLVRVESVMVNLSNVVEYVAGGCGEGTAEGCDDGTDDGCVLGCVEGTELG